MSLSKKIKEALAKILVELKSVETDKGVLEYDSENDLVAGDEVFLEGGDVPEDGAYTTKDGKVINVKDGVVESIVDPEAEVAPVEKEEMEEVEDIEKAVEEVKEELGQQIEELRTELETLKEELQKLKNEPVAEPIEEQFEKHTSLSTHNKAAEIASYLNR